MTYRVIFADRAAQELEAAARWWSEHRSAEQAERWYTGFIVALESLRVAPDRHPYAREEVRLAFGLRQLNFGMGARPTHRAVFTVRGADVIVLAIRHLAQQELSPDDIG